jgi:hypothetical protein
MTTELTNPVTGRPTAPERLQDLFRICDAGAIVAEQMLADGQEPTRQFCLAVAAGGLRANDPAAEEAQAEVRWAGAFNRAMEWSTALRTSMHFPNCAVELRAVAALANVTLGGAL